MLLGELSDPDATTPITNGAGIGESSRSWSFSDPPGPAEPAHFTGGVTDLTVAIALRCGPDATRRSRGGGMLG